jgi:hypothetical protein
MWFIWIIIGLAAFIFWMFYGASRLCPSCGTELADELGYPGQVANRCTRCGWRGN